jgi:hypothetical protein
LQELKLPVGRELPTRAQLEVDVKSNPFQFSDTLVQDADGNFYPVQQ